MGLFAYNERDKARRKIHEWFNDPHSPTVMRSRCGYGVVSDASGLVMDGRSRDVCKICSRFTPALTLTVETPHV